MTNATDEPLVAALVEQLEAVRAAERDIFGALDPEIRDRPMRAGDWSPKDHQAHVTAWKARQADRVRSVRQGDPFPVDAREDDEINAELQAARADSPWDAIVAEADEVSQRLVDEIRTAGSQVLIDSDRLVAGIFGNGPFHAATHFRWLVEADIGADGEAVERFLEEEARLLETTALPDADRGVGLYNLACAEAIAGRHDRARKLLPDAFRLRPDLAELARGDPDLVELRDELDRLLATG